MRRPVERLSVGNHERKRIWMFIRVSDAGHGRENQAPVGGFIFVFGFLAIEPQFDLGRSSSSQFRPSFGKVHHDFTNKIL